MDARNDQTSLAPLLEEAQRHHRAGLLAQAEPLYRRALDIAPHHLGACLQLGSLLFPSDHAAGLALFERAHTIDPAHAGVRSCLALGHVAAGAYYTERQDWSAAIDALRRAIDIDPHHAGAHFNLAWELLRQGHFEEGWREYEWRWRWKHFGDRPRTFAQPQWRGEPLNGARVLLHAEQGLGDALQFVRYAPLVAERGGTVILEAPRSLVRLFASIHGVTLVIPRGDPLPDVDWHCPLMSLPLAFGTTLDSIPADVPYVTAGHAPLALDSTTSPGPRARVGLVWTSGSTDDPRYQRRSIPLELLAPLTRLEGFEWYSLQVGPASAALNSLPEQTRLHDLAPAIGDFADTAALISRLDLVISVDTSVAHLAGAMGTPVWILLPHHADWRWMVGRVDSPWYPTARLFAQPAPGQWAPVVGRLAETLQVWRATGRNGGCT